MKRVLVNTKDGVRAVWVADGIQDPIAVDTRGACQALSICQKTLFKWVHEGLITPKSCGNKRLWLWEDLVELAKSLPPWCTVETDKGKQHQIREVKA